MKVEVAVLGSPYLISLMVSVDDVKQHSTDTLCCCHCFQALPALFQLIGDNKGYGKGTLFISVLFLIFCVYA